MTTASRDYPSIASVTGSTTRNRDPILAALKPWIEGSTTSKQFLEIASGTGEHAIGYAEAFPGVSFVCTERDAGGLETLRRGIAHLPSLRGPLKLDVRESEDWNAVCVDVGAHLSGVIINNLIHCSPPETSDAIFSHCATPTFLGPSAWIAIYGAFLQDDGSYASDGDRAFDERFRGLHESFGLRTIPSLANVAAQHGFALVQRQSMPAGNWFLVFQQRE